jgi:hypothetical protein
MILMCPCIIDFIGEMDYEGEWGGGGPGHSWALKWHERSTPLFCCCFWIRDPGSGMAKIRIRDLV